MPGLAHAGVEAVVGHHRHGDARDAEVDRGERDQLVAVDDRAVAVDREHAVAVAVEREAGVVAARAHGLRERVDVRGAAAVVDVAAVGLGREHLDVGAEPAEQRGRDLVGGAVGAVEQQPHAGQVERAEARLERRLVAVQRRVEAAHAARARGLGRGVEQPLDLQLGRVGELVAVAAEELDPVVLVRVVRGRQHDRQGEAVAAHQQRRAGRRQDPAEHRLAARRRDPRRHRGLEHLAGLARVADHQHARRAVVAARADARARWPRARATARARR